MNVARLEGKVAEKGGLRSKQASKQAGGRAAASAERKKHLQGTRIRPRTSIGHFDTALAAAVRYIALQGQEQGNLVSVASSAESKLTFRISKSSGQAVLSRRLFHCRLFS